jgi:pimeloyl-ACP methyl ester carboxylesterase
VRESCCQFGPQRQLAGILTEPAAEARAAVVVLVSAGITPKFGPFRLYAELARRLARDGFRTLRFDLGGIGDSGQSYPGADLQERTHFELSAALDYLGERFELRSITLAGVCSGAEDSLRHAARDARVSGVVMIDPFAYRTPGFAWRHLRYRATRRLLRAVGLYRPPASTGEAALVNYQHMAHAESSRLVPALLERRTRLHFVYTGGMREHFNHPGQLRAMFRGIELPASVKLDHFPRLDHTQLLERDRRTLIEAIARGLTDG